MKRPSQKLVDAFFAWFRANQHAQNEDHYAGQVTADVLRGLPREQFIEFFVQFARDGGLVQSGGYRTAPLFRETVETKYEDFRPFALEPFADGFDELNWLDRTKEFPGFGQGLATIYLNRVDKKRFAIINNKAVDVMSLLDVQVPVGRASRFKAIRDAERQLIEWFPEFDNYYRTDALSQFLIGEEVGQSWANELRGSASKVAGANMPSNNSDFKSRVSELAALEDDDGIRECYGMSNCARFVTNGFLCGIPNIDNLSETTGALCVLSMIQISPHSELHTAILIRKNLTELRVRMKAMISASAHGFFADKNNNCALYLYSDGKIYPYNKAKVAFELTSDVLGQLGPGIEPDALYWAVYGNDSDAAGGATDQLAALIGDEKAFRVDNFGTGEKALEWSDSEWCLGILIYNRHVVPKAITRPQAEFSRRLVKATQRSAGSWDRRIANIRFALTGSGLAGGGGTPERARLWQSEYEATPEKIVALAAKILAPSDDGRYVCEELGMPAPDSVSVFGPEHRQKFRDHLQSDSVGFQVSANLPECLINSLATKPFVILTGNSGTGKTMLAELFAQWLSGGDSNYIALIPVGADWTDNRNVLGFVNHLRLTTPEGEADAVPIYHSTRILDLLISARGEPGRPFFVILDEMNLSHVERYFADFLSTMESREGKLLLHREGRSLPRKAGGPADVPEAIQLPRNVFVIGTVNVDETTYMFSPKVLDRANVLEFRVNVDAPETFLGGGGRAVGNIAAAPAGYAEAFLALSRRARGLDHADPLALIRDPANPPANAIEPLEKCHQTMIDLFALMHERHQEFAFRSMAEILRFLAVDYEMTPEDKQWDWRAAMDAQILQKILPKLHGSKRKIGPLLAALATYCEKADKVDAARPLSNEILADGYVVSGDKVCKNPTFSSSHNKLCEMIQSVRRDQFVSFIQ